MTKWILETERLKLRALIEEDAQWFFDLNNDPEVIKYTGNAPFESLDEARAFLKNYTDYQQNGYGRWAVLRKEDDKIIGWCGLKYNEEEMVDIGFRFFKKEWGKGYASESAKACLEYGFNELGIKEIIGRAMVNNKASHRVLEKIGMEFWKEGVAHGMEKVVYYVMRDEG